MTRWPTTATQAVEDEADDADVDERHDDVGRREEFHASQMKKPMPTPPVSISAATIASQDRPMPMRRPVKM